MNTVTAMCPVHGTIRVCTSYAAADAAARTHQSVHDCYAWPQIVGAR